MFTHPGLVRKPYSQEQVEYAKEKITEILKNKGRRMTFKELQVEYYFPDESSEIKNFLDTELEYRGKLQLAGDLLDILRYCLVLLDEEGRIVFDPSYIEFVR